jgi:hypothetical protein
VKYHDSFAKTHMGTITVNGPAPAITLNSPERAGNPDRAGVRQQRAVGRPGDDDDERELHVQRLADDPDGVPVALADR